MNTFGEGTAFCCITISCWNLAKLFDIKWISQNLIKVREIVSHRDIWSKPEKMLTSDLEETLKSAREYARDHLMRTDIQELMAVHRPPLELEVVLSVACMLLGMTEHVTEFRKCHQFLSAPETMRSIIETRHPSQVSRSALENCKAKIKEHANFFDGTSSLKWNLCIVLSKWSVAIVGCAAHLLENQ